MCNGRNHFRKRMAQTSKIIFITKTRSNTLSTFRVSIAYESHRTLGSSSVKNGNKCFFDSPEELSRASFISELKSNVQLQFRYTTKFLFVSEREPAGGKGRERFRADQCIPWRCKRRRERERVSWITKGMICGPATFKTSQLTKGRTERTWDQPEFLIPGRVRGRDRFSHPWPDNRFY